jgi:DNA invertase Pin-like site-specific DNA recombinase
MNDHPKLTAPHLEKKAIVYLRQSSEKQAKHNLESQRLQYALVDRARSLGFSRVEVIDKDLGASASLGARRREGFEQLLASVALGEVGLILSREVSRLSRNDKDFCHLLELCQLFGTLLADAETLYDLSSMDDQLVLGLKGTLSVVELRTLKLRMHQGKENKARRGEYYPLLPPGYVWDDSAKNVVKDPNARVQQAFTLLFSKFRETWSMRQTFKWFRDNDIELPVNKFVNGKKRMIFQVPRYTFVQSVLKNPIYAGAYVYGRRPTEAVFKNGVLKKRQAKPLPVKEAKVFIASHHEGYIDWSTYEENLRRIAANDMRNDSDDKVGAVRAGQGLLTGLLRCGRCGRKIHVRYWGKSGTAARYLCSGTFTAGGSRYCLGFGGALVDRRFGEELVAVLSPLAIRASLLALETIGEEQRQHGQALERRVEQLEYEAARAFEQYDEVDPRNRLVASELEKRWNDKLRELAEARAKLVELTTEKKSVSDEQRARLTSLGQCFPDVWSHPGCSNELKKKIIRALVEEVIANETQDQKLSFTIRWKGGDHTRFEMPRPTSSGKNAEEDLEVIRKMASFHTDDEIARVLNKLGRKTGKGKPWSEDRVRTARTAHNIDAPVSTGAETDVLSLQAAARYADVSDTTIKKLVEAAILPMQQAVPFAPWRITRSDLDADPVRRVLDGLKRTGRLRVGDRSEEQQELFSTKSAE